MKRLSIFLVVMFVLGLAACGQEPKIVVETVEVTRVVEVVETVEVTRVVEVEVLVTPEPSSAQVAAEAFAETTGLGEEAFEILAGTHRDRFKIGAFFE